MLEHNGLLKELFDVDENLFDRVAGPPGHDEHLLSNLKEEAEKSGDRANFLIVTCECVQKGKPAPDLFLEACRRLGVSPANCRGFEDADLGIQSLRNADFREENIVDVRKIEGYPK